MTMGRYGTKVGELVAEGQFETATMLIELMQAVDTMAELSANLFTCANEAEASVMDWRARWEQMKDARNALRQEFDGFIQRKTEEEAKQGSATTVLAMIEARYPHMLPDTYADYMIEKRKIDAIKLLRAETGMGLKDAKNEIERRWTEAGYPI